MTKRTRKFTAITGGIAALITGCTTPAKGPQTAPTGIEVLLSAVVDHNGDAVTSEALLGHWSVLWFYPKAQTGG